MTFRVSRGNTARIDVDLSGQGEVQALLDQMSGPQLRNRLRRVVRAGAAIFRKIIRSTARSGDFPATFAKTRTRNHRHPIATSVWPDTPLVNIWERGAKVHSIGTPGALLSNAGRDARGSGGESLFVARGPVTHPGMEARPIVGPAFESGKDDAEQAMETKLWEGVR